MGAETSLQSVLGFVRALKRNNNRDWFQAHRDDYEVARAHFEDFVAALLHGLSRTETLADAYRRAEIIKGEGDAAAADLYARAHSRNPDFFAFHRSMQAYRRSLGKEGDIMVLAPDGEFFKYMKESGR